MDGVEDKLEAAKGFVNESEAVEALYETMVLLREELVKKNSKIKVLETKLNKKFDEIQVEQVEGVCEEDMCSSPSDNADTSVKSVIDLNVVTEDPVMEFKLSDDEEEEEKKKQLDSMEISDVRVHTLIIKKDIDVHDAPKSRSSSTSKSPKNKFYDSGIRPILKQPSSSPRSCTGSQTDISTLSPSNLTIKYPKATKGDFTIF